MTTLLEVAGVTKTFDGFRAINGLSISIGETELRAVIGPNGAGKTTFMDIITGKTKPDEGKVLWGPRSVSLLGLSESRIAQMGIGRKFQRPVAVAEQSQVLRIPHILAGEVSESSDDICGPVRRAVVEDDQPIGAGGLRGNRLEGLENVLLAIVNRDNGDDVGLHPAAG